MRIEYSKSADALYVYFREKEVLDKIKKSVFEIQKIVFSKLTMAHVPRLHFFADETEEEAQHIEELLDKIKEKNKI